MSSHYHITFPLVRIEEAKAIISNINKDLLANITVIDDKSAKFSISSRHTDAFNAVIALQTICRHFEHVDANAVAVQEADAIEKQILYKPENIAYYFALELPAHHFTEFFKNLENKMQFMIAENLLPAATLGKFASKKNVYLFFASSYEQDPKSLETCFRNLSVSSPKFYFNTLFFQERTLFLSSLETKRNRDFLRTIYFDLVSAFPKNTTRFEAEVPKIPLLENLNSEPKIIIEEFNQIQPILLGPIFDDIKLHILRKDGNTFKSSNVVIL